MVCVCNKDCVGRSAHLFVAIFYTLRTCVFESDVLLQWVHPNICVHNSFFAEVFVELGWMQIFMLGRTRR
jgi:hypothetical protein